VPNAVLESIRAKQRERAASAHPFAEPTGPFRRIQVEFSRELERILAIPHHPGYTDADRDLVREIVTRPNAHGGRVDPATGLCATCRAPVRLWDRQANALLASLEAKGCVASLAVGGGKTLIAALIPTVLERSSVVLTTASLRSQFLADLEAYRAHFVIRKDLAVVPYTTLSNAARRDILDELDPDVIVADEVHSLKNGQSARTRRFLRYFRDRQRARRPVLFCALTGTLAKRSIHDYGRLTNVALREWSPVPRDYPTLCEWSEAIDPPTQQSITRAPGALLALSSVEEVEEHGEVEAARRGFARRFYSTRGVVNGNADEDVRAELVIRLVEAPNPLAVRDARRKLGNTWCRPDGEELTTSAHVAEVDRQIRLGGWYGWIGEPDRRWLEARKLFHRELREWLSDHPRNRIDSPMLVCRALEQGDLEFDSWALWREMREIKPPRTAWYWITQEIAEWCAKYAREHAPCILFVRHVAFGERVAELAEIPYYGEGKRAAHDIAHEPGTRSIVASLGAHGQGRNLQRYAHALIVDPPPTGLAWEQLLGRMHRPGQSASRVEYALLGHFKPELEAARSDARYLESTTGVRQKLTTATIDLSAGQPEMIVA
jgi:hypothetical protein